MPAHTLTSAQTRVIQVTWFVVAIIVLMMYILAVPAFINDISSRVGESAQPFDIPLTSSQVAAVSSIGLNRFIYAGWIVSIGLIVGISYWLVAFIIFGANRRNWVLAATTLMMLTYIATEVAVLESLKDAPSPWGQLAWIVIEVIQAIGEILTLVIYFIFPDGQFRPRWTRFAALLYTGFVLLCLLIPTFPLNVLNGDVFDQTPLLSALHALIWHLVAVWALIYKYKRVLDRETVARTKWFAIGILFAFIISALRYIIPAFIQDSEWLQDPAAQVIYKMLLRPTQWLLLLVVPISLGITQIVGNAIDARKRADELQRERERLVTQREEVLNKISNDVHDDLLPDLNLEILRLDQVISHIAYNPNQSLDLINESKRQLQDIMKRLRGLTHEWRPPLLDQLGFVEAVRAEAISITGAQINGNTALKVSVMLPNEPLALTPAIETTAYRIIREALKNVVTHSQASHCEVSISLNGHLATRRSSQQRVLSVQILDNGIGFAKSHSHGRGLISMRQRAEEIGGHLDWRNADTRGALIWAQLPLTYTVEVFPEASHGED